MTLEVNQNGNYLGAVHILRNTRWGEGGLPDLLQYYIGGSLESLLQYYSFKRKSHHFILVNVDL